MPMVQGVENGLCDISIKLEKIEVEIIKKKSTKDKKEKKKH